MSQYFACESKSVKFFERTHQGKPAVAKRKADRVL